MPKQLPLIDRPRSPRLDRRTIEVGRRGLAEARRQLALAKARRPPVDQAEAA